MARVLAYRMHLLNLDAGIRGDTRLEVGTLPETLLEGKKEEFPGHTDDVLPGNSFPQICVVSRDSFLEVAVSVQEYGRTMDQSNIRAEQK